VEFSCIIDGGKSHGKLVALEVAILLQRWYFSFTDYNSTMSQNKLSYSCSSVFWHFKSSSFTLLLTSHHLVSFHFTSPSHLCYDEIAIANWPLSRKYVSQSLAGRRLACAAPRHELAVLRATAYDWWW
jgi:hypothetical protein